jgi:hypothetical protein
LGRLVLAAKLHIAGVNGEAFRWSNSSTVYGRLICGTAGARIDVTGANSGYGLSFSMDDSTKMIILPSGNVGIGTTGPSRLLHLDAVTDQPSTPFSPFLLNSRTTGNMADGFGGGMLFGINDATLTNENIIATGNVGIGTTSPKNKLDIVGSLGRGAPVTKTTDFTVAATENWLIMNGTATITITLPTASSFTGRELMIKNIAAYTVISASSNVKPIDTDNAATAILPATAGSWCTLVSDGTNWVTMMN